MKSLRRLNLQQAKIQAKELVKAHHNGSHAVCPILRRLFQFQSKSNEQVLAAPLALHQAQYALAMHLGFRSWDALKNYTETGQSNRKLTVVHTRDRTELPGIAPLAWDSGRECTLFGAMATLLQSTGDQVSYFELMGLNAAAFRLRFASPRWDYSSVDGQLGYDHATAAANALGYESYAMWSSEPDIKQRARITRSIDNGVPALGIDLHVTAEWAVIAGYTEHNTWLVRSYFEGFCETETDVNKPYVDSDRWPWLSFVFGSKRKRPEPDVALRTALAIARQNATQGPFQSGGGCRYVGGLEAFTTWADELMQEPRYDPADMVGLHHHAGVNQFLFDSLQDSRDAAVRFLKLYQDAFSGHERTALTKLLGLYEREQNLICQTHRYLPGHPDDKRLTTPWHWDAQMRLRQSEALMQMRELEQEAFHIMTIISGDN